MSSDAIAIHPILPYPILSYLILSYPIVSYRILSYPIPSYPILSYPILSYHILFFYLQDVLAEVLVCRGRSALILIFHFSVIEGILQTAQTARVLQPILTASLSTSVFRKGKVFLQS
jgi:hypothetical protein